MITAADVKVLRNQVEKAIESLEPTLVVSHLSRSGWSRFRDSRHSPSCRWSCRRRNNQS